MGESITQPDTDAPRGALRRFLRVLEAALAGAVTRATEPDAAATLDGFARLVRSVETTDLRLDPAVPRAHVCRFWDAALRAASGSAQPLAAALGALGPSLSWTQNPNYRRRPPDATFLDNYGYAVVAGPSDGPPALALEPRLALGVLLLGPHAHYPLHAHPAVEVYYTLTPGGEWWRDDGPWRETPAGAAIHHAPNVRHATRAGASPLLAIYLWRGDLATHAALV
jgi:hypothetical protein